MINPDAGMREAFVRVLASLAAAISILERTPKAKKAAASDKMFDTMLDDYRKALEAGRAALTSIQGEDAAEKVAQIIDPSAWRDQGYKHAEWRIQQSLIKARAILATIEGDN